MHLDGKTKEYVKNDPDGRTRSAYTHEQLVKTFRENQRGWLLADYYFDNALTDPQSKQFVINNMTYHFDASDDGGVKIFSWDHSVPLKYQSSMCIVMGKNASNPGDGMPASEELEFTLQSVPPAPKMMLLTKGIDAEGEAIVLVNGQQFAIPTRATPNADAFVNMVELPPGVLKPGKNTLQFAYNTDVSEFDIDRGFAILNMEIM
jgi:hypothetical protein